MKIYKITEASDYLGVSINTLKTLANIGFELNPQAYEVFVPTLSTVEELPDVEPLRPDEQELVKRNKMREKWRTERQKRKQQTHPATILF